MQVVSILKASNFTFWPEAGGLFDQDAFLIEDILLWLTLENRIKWEQKAESADDSLFSDKIPVMKL
jgi:hypothetical protein